MKNRLQHIKSYYKRYILVALTLIFSPSIIEMYQNQYGWVWSFVSWVRNCHFVELLEKPIMELSVLDLCEMIAIFLPGCLVIFLLRAAFLSIWEKNEIRETHE